MKILHTSDWHLGRTFKGESLIEDHAYFLSQLMDIILTQEPDVLIIAGDIFDRASPPASAISQFDEFQRQVYHNTATALVILAGNHDSGERIGINGPFADRNRVLIRGRLEKDDTPLILNDEYGPIAFSALPFGEIYAARETFDNTRISSPADVIAAQVECARKHIPTNARWIISAHAFVTGASTTESERSLSVGGIETVSASVFEGAHYVALGHLHRAQKVGSDHIRYSGSPLAFAFDEAGSEKSVTMITLGRDGVSNIELLPLKALRQVRILKGNLRDLENMTNDPNRSDLVHAVLTDTGALVDPMARLRKTFPNAITLEREARQTTQSDGKGRATAKLNDPQAVIREFLTYVRDDAISDNEQAILDTAFKDISNEKA
ncbi:exonuclease SbcCD subunit D [Hirschia litorea]|uniref:Nuclease SbcCD subunit D n=1 Tax=Hirschia litorea TaxID=1199156 RepID=A0ABW2IMS5_9PROT